MANIYQKTVSDKTCILSPREFILRPFDFGDDWTEVRVGMYFSAVAASGDNTNSASETVTLSTAADLVCFGIKDSASNDIPGFGDALFLGVMNRSGNNSLCSGSGFGTTHGTLWLSAGGYHETTLVGAGASEEFTKGLACPSAASGSSDYCAFGGVKFTISNRGTSSQSVAISLANANISGTDYSASALRLDMNNQSYGTPASIAWNDGAVARDIPDAFYCRMPFYSNRIRLSAIRAIRYAP